MFPFRNGWKTPERFLFTVLKMLPGWFKVIWTNKLIGCTTVTSRGHCCAGDTTALQSLWSPGSRQEMRKAATCSRTSLQSGHSWDMTQACQIPTLNCPAHAALPEMRFCWKITTQKLQSTGYRSGWFVTCCGVSICEQPARQGLAGPGVGHARTRWGRAGDSKPWRNAFTWSFLRKTGRRCFCALHNSHQIVVLSVSWELRVVTVQEPIGKVSSFSAALPA